MPRSEAEQLLQEEGDWLVRAAQVERGGPTRLYVSVKWGPRRHYPVKYCRQTMRCSLHSSMRTFPGIVALVEHYRQRPLPNGIPLRHLVQRPKHMIASDNLVLDGRLGSGQFATVYSAWLRRGDGRRLRVAVKASRALASDVDFTHSVSAREELMREAKTMIQLRHPNVVRCFGVAADRFPLQLVLELCAGGSLLVSHIIIHRCMYLTY